MDEKRINSLMKTLDLTKSEAIELIKEDEEIDRMTVKEAENDLTPEQKKVIKKAKAGAKAVNAVNAYGKKVVIRKKENKVKQALIAEIYDFLTKNSKNPIENCEILNKNRQIFFKCGENSYELTLVEKRKTKK
jgi:hypothetical protein